MSNLKTDEFKKLENELLETISSTKDELTMLLRDLIRIRSYSGQEEHIVKFIRQKMGEFGFDGAVLDRFGNVVGRIGDGPVKILYDAHVDTVKVTHPEKWKYPPFEGTIKDGKIYGRGAVDEKPAMACFLVVGKYLRQFFKNGSLPFTLYVVGSCFEEDADGYPLKHLIEEEGIKPQYVLLGEPTDLKVCRGQRGRMELSVETSGVAAHGGHNIKGINAVYKIAPIIRAIEALDPVLPAREPLGKGSITVTDVASRGPSLNSVPDYARIHLDRRLIMGETRESVIDELKNILENNGVDARISVPELKGTSWTGMEFAQEECFPAWVYDEDHPLVRAGLGAAEQATGQKAESCVWNFSTNGVATAGRLGIPTIGFAPAKEELAHTSEEECSLDDLVTAARFYTLLPFRLCRL